MSHKRKHSATFSPFDGLESSRIRDVFPMKICNEFRCLNKLNFKNHMAVALPFILFQYPHDRGILFYNLDEEIGNYKDRLDRLLRGSTRLNAKTGTENVSWSKLEKKYKKLPVSIRKRQNIQNLKTFRLDAENDDDEDDWFGKKPREQNADQRLSFRFDNMFAVKQLFTFGERRTASGEVHIIQTSDVPILYNEPKPEWKKNFEDQWKIGELISSDSSSSNDYPINEREGRFDAVDQPFFNTYVLNPRCKYIIPENTIYILLTTQKTFFSLDRMKTQTAQEISKTVHFMLPNTQKQLLLEMEEESECVVTTYSNKPNDPKSLKLNTVDQCRQWQWINEIKPPKIIGRPRGRPKKEIKFTPTSMTTTPIQQQQETERQSLNFYASDLSSCIREPTWENESVPSFVLEPTQQQHFIKCENMLTLSPTQQYMNYENVMTLSQQHIDYIQNMFTSSPTQQEQQQHVNYIQNESYENIDSPPLPPENTTNISSIANEAVDSFLNDFFSKTVLNDDCNLDFSFLEE